MWISYESYKTQKLFSNLVHTNALEIEKKNPADFIYIKHTIYRESIKYHKMKEEHERVRSIRL